MNKNLSTRSFALSPAEISGGCGYIVPEVEKSLKHLKGFICNREVIRYAVLKVLSGRARKPSTKPDEHRPYRNREAAWIEGHLDEFVESLRSELVEGRYRCGRHRPKHIPGKWKGQKDRDAYVLSLKDQTVQTISQITNK